MTTIGVADVGVAALCYYGGETPGGPGACWLLVVYDTVLWLMYHQYGHQDRDNRNFIVHLMGPFGWRLLTLRLHSSMAIKMAETWDMLGCWTEWCSSMLAETW